MSYWHFEARDELRDMLKTQLDPHRYRVRIDGPRVARATESYYIPDLVVVPVAMTKRYHREPRSLEVYREPLPLVVEVWSPSTGDYDVEEKRAAYQLRGDLEIWYIHPFERTQTAWRRQSNESYEQVIYRGGVVRPPHLPKVAIDLDALFNLIQTS